MATIHLQLPDRSLACGAEHQKFVVTCCRRDVAKVNCPVCILQAPLMPRATDKRKAAAA